MKKLAVHLRLLLQNQCFGTHYSSWRVRKKQIPTYLAQYLAYSAVNLPLILIAYLRGRKGDRERHLKIARWAFPIWLYVSVTGVLIYLILYVWFPGEVPS